MGRVRIGLLVFFLSLSSCTAPLSGADFYEGLKKRQAPSAVAAGAATGATASAVAHFEKALDNDNPVIAGAAAAELMSLHFAGVEFSDAKMAAIREKAASKAAGRAAGSWARAFEALESLPSTAASLALLMDGDSRSLGEAERYVLDRCDAAAEAAPDADTALAAAFTEAEHAAIDGRFAVSRSRYNEALIFFRIALSDAPELFFRYPELLADLGRTFQYAATGREGIELFLKWEKMLLDGDGLPAAESAAVPSAASSAAAAAAPKMALREFVPVGSENLVRFRLLFFAARIARQRGDSAAIELFEKALPFAREVSPEQTDACIWYILDTSLAKSSLGASRTIRYLETYVSQWHSDAYFSDVLDKLTRELVFKRQWNDILNLFTLLKDKPDAAKHAWIISRAIEEKLFSPPALAAASAAADAAESASIYMRAAYNAGSNAARIGNSGWYYRSLSAAALGEPFLTLQEAPASVSQVPPPNVALSDTMLFLLGFFEHDAVQFAPRYIKAEENNLTPEELYLLAEALNKAGQYQESMRLVSLYTRRNDYQVTRQDLELLYPRPFKELVEQYAEENGFEPALLFGLIRTESAFSSGVVSRAGAIGLSQLMPATAQEAAVRIHRRGGPNYAAEGSALDLYDPVVNIHIGASYLAFLNERMEDPLLALLSYNGGMNRVRRWRRASNAAKLPPDLFMETVEYSETRNYGRNVLGAAAMYRNLY